MRLGAWGRWAAWRREAGGREGRGLVELEGRLPPWLAPGQSPPAAATTTTATASTTTATTDNNWKAPRAGHRKPPSTSTSPPPSPPPDCTSTQAAGGAVTGSDYHPLCYCWCDEQSVYCVWCSSHPVCCGGNIRTIQCCKTWCDNHPVLRYGVDIHHPGCGVTANQCITTQCATTIQCAITVS